ncbi:MAG TPA: hypothetical protein VGP61_06630 [Gemmatimonadales bacterium]|nr:hypothetical protein [Gemmatimonadales bacterium]
MSPRRYFRVLLILGCATAVVIPRAAAQGMRSDDVSEPGPSMVRYLGLPGFTGRPGTEMNAVTAPTLTVSGAPRSYLVVSIPVPAGMPKNRPISYEVTQSGLAAILGALSGTIAPDPARPRSILVTLPVPNHSRAGTLPIAKVRFFVDGMAPVDVPIQVSIAAIQRIELTAVDGLRAVRPGDAFTLTFRLTNLGNALDTVEVRVLAPGGWRLPAGMLPAALPLDVHATADRSITIGVPLGSSTGSASVRLVALVHGQPVATVDVPVQVLEDASSSPHNGARLTTAAGLVAGSGAAPLSAFAAALDGQLTDDIRVTARATVVPNRRADGLYGLSRTGLYPLTPSLLLSASAWRLGLGLTSARLTDLTGVGVAGDGGSLDLIRSRWSASAYAARPEYGDERHGGALAGGRLDLKLGTATLTGSASHLAEQRTDPRRLDAFSLGAALPAVFQGVLSTEVAQRWFAGGHGLGWAANYERRDAGTQLSLRLSHAPGGNAAFARATDEIMGMAARSFGRVSLQGSYWHTGDEARVGLTSLLNSGGSLGMQLQLSQGVGISLTGRRSAFSASGSSGSFGSRETALDGSLNVRRQALYGSLSGSFAGVERVTRTLTGTDLHESAPRTSARAALGATGASGTLELTARFDYGGSSVGFLARQAEFGLRADRIPLIASGSTRLFATGSIQRMTWFGDRKALTALTAGVAVELPAGLAVGLNAERNPFILTPSGTGGWFYGVKVERTTVLPRLARTQTRGVVFQDQNGNGARDAGEPGFAGVLLLRGSQSVVSASDGSFQFVGQSPEAVSIDPQSLPIGFIVGGVKQTLHPELAVVAVAAVEVALELTPQALERVSTDALARAVVMAHDQNGRTWVARMGRSGVATFDALPPGRYTVELDLADIEEPLTPIRGLPEFIVGGEQPAPRLVVQLRPRPIKLNNLNAGGAGSGGGAPPKGDTP